MPESINCSICNNLCSTKATSCPKCGHPINPIKQSEKFLELKYIQVGLWILFVIGAFWALTCWKIWDDMPEALIGYGNERRTAAFVSIFLRLGFFLLISTLLYVSYANKKER
jgi:hypothetical protein